MAGLRALGFAGANVTMPHKTDAAASCDRLSEDASRLRAVNTLVVEAEVVIGENTDAPGFDRFLRHDVGVDPAGRSALIFGAGGAARAVALALARAGVATMTVLARDPRRAVDIREAVGDLPAEVLVRSFDDGRPPAVDLVVNATPLGANGETLPLPPLGPGVVVIDLLYAPARTPLLRAARDAGAGAHGGLGLLLHQAALSFERWTGRVAPMDAMSAAATGHLAQQIRPGDAV